MAFNEKDGTGYASFRILSYHQQVKRVQLRYSKMVNQELTLLILVTHLLMIQNFHSQSFYTNQPVPPPWLNGGDLGRDVINYYFRDREKKITTIPINHRKLKAINKIMIQTQIVILTMMRNKFIRNIKNYSLQLHL